MCLAKALTGQSCSGRWEGGGSTTEVGQQMGKPGPTWGREGPSHEHSTIFLTPVKRFMFFAVKDEGLMALGLEA